MSEFVNTIDLLGDEVVTKALVEKTIAEFNDDVLTRVGNYAFYECSSLAGVNLPNATMVGERAFQNCKSLTSVDMPNVTTVRSNGFDGCTNLARINMPNLTGLEGYVFQNCSSLARVDFPLVKGNLPFAFTGCSSLTSAKLRSATALSATFYKCSNLTEVDVPSVTQVGSAFKDCTSLAFVDLPIVTQIASQAFYGCVSLKTIALRSTTLCTLSATDAFSGLNESTRTPFYQGGTGGTLLAPSALVENYKTATNWSVIWGYGHNRFLALEDYTVDGTITGEIDWDKLNGGTTA